MVNFEYDYRFLKAGLEELEKYLLSQEVFWPLSLHAAVDQAPYPQMTLGWLLLAYRRAKALARNPDENADIERQCQKLEEIRARWRTAWAQKARREFRNRLNLWRDFLEEYHKETETHFDRYGYEVGRRVLLQLLLGEAEELPEADQEMLDGLDEWLRTIIHPGEFTWQGELIETFPKETYWFLYGSLPKNSIDGSRSRSR